MLVSDGWQGMVEGKPNTDLIPTALIVHRFFQAEAQVIEQLEEERDAVGRQMEEMEEEHGGEEGLLVEAQTDKGKLSKASVRARLTEIKKDPDADEERELLEGYLKLIDQQATGNKKVKAAQKELTAKVVARYGKLTEDEIQSLVVDDKWMAVLTDDIQGELDRVSQALTGRIRELAERYAKPLPEFTEEVQTLAGRVDEHLKRMGVVWS